MELNVGYELIYDLPQPTPMLLVLHIHYSRASDILVPDHIIADPPVPLSAYRDGFGNWCSRLTAPEGRFRIASHARVRDTGKPDSVVKNARQHTIEELPEETLVFLLASRYCDTDKLAQAAWDLFGRTKPGWERVQAVCDFVHNHIKFNYMDADPTRTASDAFNQKRGVCRDFTHLAIAFCRALNIPARYCTGYLSDIGTPKPWAVGDFAAWFEAYIGGRWQMFDPRNNTPRVGRVLMARGRDAIDVAITTTFGDNTLTKFTVITEEANAEPQPPSKPVKAKRR